MSSTFEAVQKARRAGLAYRRVYTLTEHGKCLNVKLTAAATVAEPEIRSTAASPLATMRG